MSTIAGSEPPALVCKHVFGSWAQAAHPDCSPNVLVAQTPHMNLEPQTTIYRKRWAKIQETTSGGIRTFWTLVRVAFLAEEGVVEEEWKSVEMMEEAVAEGEVTTAGDDPAVGSSSETL